MRAGITEAIQAMFPNETVAIDILGPFPISKNGYVWILTMIDTFTRWPVAVPLKDRSSASIAAAIYKFWICEKSVPLKIVSDRAREFVSKGMKQLASFMGITMITTAGYNPTGNSSVERFHRYFNSALSIVFDKIEATWDDFIPSVLFSYRASINDTTGYSPFFLEHGRNPQLPLENLFPYLQKKEERKDYVQNITDKLDFAFTLARERQAAAAEKNKSRKHTQYKPKFKTGDFLLVKKRTAGDNRLEERDEEGNFIPLPEKLRNVFTGPYEMLRWAGDRHCVILIKDKEVRVNVNRLIKHHVWDEEHPSTDTPPASVPARTEDRYVGDLIVFPMAENHEHKCCFGVGKILEIRSEQNIFIQWLGNYFLAAANKPFDLAWVSTSDNKGYYRSKRVSPTHPPWTNEDTSTNVTMDSIITKGDILRADGHINAGCRAKIEATLGKSIAW